MAKSSFIVFLFALVSTDVTFLSSAAAQSDMPGVSFDTGFTGDNNGITDPSSLTLPCRSSADILAISNISVHAGDQKCMTAAVTCTSGKLSTCAQQQLAGTSGPLVAVARDCAADAAAQGRTSGSAVFACLIPAVLKNCAVSGCSSCSSSISASFDDMCTSRGGQLCRQTSVLFGQRIHGQSMCAPSVCSSKLLATSVAKIYSNLTRHALQSNPDLQSPSILDNEISCGTGAQSYTVRSSAPDKAVSGSRSLQTANSLAAIAAVFSALAALLFL